MTLAVFLDVRALAPSHVHGDNEELPEADDMAKASSKDYQVKASHPVAEDGGSNIGFAHQALGCPSAPGRRATRCTGPEKKHLILLRGRLLSKLACRMAGAPKVHGVLLRRYTWTSRTRVCALGVGIPRAPGHGPRSVMALKKAPNFVAS